MSGEVEKAPVLHGYREREDEFYAEGGAGMKGTVEKILEKHTGRTSGAERGFRGAEEMSRLFASAVFLPSQLPSPRAVGAAVMPERLLMLAVLDGAIRAYAKGALIKRNANKAAYTEAREWLESNDRSWPFSFLNICDALGFDPGYLRRGLGCSSTEAARREGGNSPASRCAGGNGGAPVVSRWRSGRRYRVRQ